MSSKNIAKNTTFYTVALAMQKALAFIYFIYIARIIGVESMGKYSFALGFTTIFAMILDFGITQVLIRESARDKDKAQKYLANTLGLKIVGSVLIYGLIVLAVNLMGYPEITKKMVYVSGIVMILDTFAWNFYGILRGLQNLKFESLGVVINQALILGFGFLVLKFDLGLVALVGVYLVGVVFNFVYSASLLKAKYNIKPSIHFDREIIKVLIKMALPFAIASIFIRLYSYMDVVLLSKLAGDEAVGLYSVAYKVAFALQFIGLAASAAFYPAFCSYFVKSKELLARAFEKVIYYLIAISLPLTFGVIILASSVIGPIFGEQYNASIPALIILMIAIPLAFLNLPVGNMLNACNRQTRNTINLGLTAGSNIIFNIILIPIWGFTGAALAALLSYIVLFVAGIVVVGKIAPYNGKKLIISFFKVLISCILMGLIVLYLQEVTHFVVAIIIGGIVYFGVLYAVGGFNIKELRRTIGLVKSSKQ